MIDVDSDGALDREEFATWFESSDLVGLRRDNRVKSAKHIPTPCGGGPGQSFVHVPPRTFYFIVHVIKSDSVEICSEHVLTIDGTTNVY